MKSPKGPRTVVPKTGRMSRQMRRRKTNRLRLRRAALERRKTPPPEGEGVWN